MLREELLGREVVDPAVCTGKAPIRRTRTDIATILDGLVKGLTPKESIDHYPALQSNDVRAAVVFAAKLGPENVWKISAW